MVIAKIMEVVTEDRLQKISPLPNLLIKKPIVPKENVCIDETLVSFREPVSFRQLPKYSCNLESNADAFGI